MTSSPDVNSLAMNLWLGVIASIKAIKGLCLTVCHKINIWLREKEMGHGVVWCLAEFNSYHSCSLTSTKKDMFSDMFVCYICLKNFDTFQSWNRKWKVGPWAKKQVIWFFWCRSGFNHRSNILKKFHILAALGLRPYHCLSPLFNFVASLSPLISCQVSSVTYKSKYKSCIKSCVSNCTVSKYSSVSPLDTVILSLHF